jgi:hypothetical protein
MTSENEKGNPPNPGSYGQNQVDQWLSLAASLPALTQNGASLPALAQNGALAGLLGGSYGLHSAPAPPISLRGDNVYSSAAPSGMNFGTNDFNSNNKSGPVHVPAPNNIMSQEILALLASSLRQQQQQPMQPSLPNLGGGNASMHNTLNQQLPPPWGTEQSPFLNSQHMTSSLDPSAIFPPTNCHISAGNNAAAILNSFMPPRQQPQLLSLQQQQDAQYHHQTPPVTSMAAAPPGKEETNQLGLTHRPSILLFMDCDEDSLSQYQCFLRQQIEAFEAGPDDIKGTAQGRNTPIQLGQVGIRCRHCASLPKAARPRGAVYYSQKIEGLYQVAQNMSKVHILGRCSQVPDHVKSKLLALRQVNQRASGGKDYWGDGLRALGIYEDGRCMRFQPRTVSASPPAGQK